MHICVIENRKHCAAGARRIVFATELFSSHSVSEDCGAVQLISLSLDSVYRSQTVKVCLVWLCLSEIIRICQETTTRSAVLYIQMKVKVK